MAEDRPGPRPAEPPTPRRQPVTDGGRADDADDGPVHEEDDELDRRRLIMWVLVVAFAVPLVVEGATLVGLVGPYVDGDGSTAPSPTPTSTPAGGLTEGGEFLDGTDRSERVTTLALRSGSDAWTFTLSVRVENTGDLPYELRLGAVTTDADRRVEGSATTGRLAPGGTATVSAQWVLPEGDRPTSIAVTAVEYDDGERVLVEREVRVGHVPVEG